MNEKIDKSNMFQSIWDFPENIIDAVELSENISLKNIYDSVNKIVIAGMGGSALVIRIRPTSGWRCCVARSPTTRT